MVEAASRWAGLRLAKRALSVGGPCLRVAEEVRWGRVKGRPYTTSDGGTWERGTATVPDTMAGVEVNGPMLFASTSLAARIERAA